jgi:hypothetical protein
VTGRTFSCMVKRSASSMTDNANFFSKTNRNNIIHNSHFFKNPFREILVLLTAREGTSCKL